MSAGADEHAGISEVPKVELEENSTLNSSSCEDLRKVDGDCNGILHDSAEEVDGDVKDDGDSSYVFVNEPDFVSDDLEEKDLDADCVVDPTENVNTESVVRENSVSDLSVGSPSGEKLVEVEEVSVEKGDDDPYCVENGCNVEKSAVSSSTNDIDVEGSLVEPNGDEISKNDTVQEQNKILLAMEVEGNQESLITTAVAVDSKSCQFDQEEKVEEQNELESLVEVESSAKVEGNQESQSTVGKAVECELQQLNNEEEVKNGEKTEEQNKLDSTTEVEENQESQIMVREAVESELHQLHARGEKVGEQSKVESATEGDENQIFQVTTTRDVDLDSDKLDNGKEKETEVTDEIPQEDPSGGIMSEQELRLEAAISPISTQLETESVNGSDVSGESLHTGPAEHIASEIEVINDLAEGHKNMNTCPIVDSESKSENADVSIENPTSFPCPVDDLISETEVENMSIEHSESLPTVDDTRSETEVIHPSGKISESFPETKVGNGSIEGVESITICLTDNRISESGIGNGFIEGDDSVPTCVVEDVQIESEVINGSDESARSLPICHVNDVEIDSEVKNSSIQSSSSLPTCHVADVEIDSDVKNSSVQSSSSLPTCHVADVEIESEAAKGSGPSAQDMPSADAVNLEAEVQSGFVENSETAPRCINDVLDVENGGGQFTSGDSDGKPIFREAEDVEGIQVDETAQSSLEVSSTDALDEQKVDTEVDKNSLYFLIRIPRYVDDKLREQIALAQLQVEEKTKSRDAIRSTIQLKRATCNEYRDNFEAAKLEERAARDALNATRQEIDSIQSAISIEDIDDRIHNMEHMIQHETMPLKEEKQLIREIKQLKHHREQLSSNMGRQDELQQSLDQKDRGEEHFKLLKQELDSLRKKVSQTEGITKAAKEKYFDENEKLRKLQAQFKAADDLRQEAYTHLQSLRKDLYEKNNYFRTYKDELRLANDYASAGDRKALQRLCVNQVETIMELWNKNDEFRNEYIRCNTMSTLKRLKTLDGRSLGPDEEPLVLQNVVDERVALSKINSALVVSPSEPKKSVVPLGPEKPEGKSMVKVEQKGPIDKSKRSTKSTSLENSSVTVSGREVKEEVAEEENKKTKEEEEMARKAEELRKEEAAAKLKEQCRLEEKAKAKEAEERKRRNAEKAQARAELRAQKEAELKAKEREKRARKKERKKAAAVEATNGGNEGESAPTSEGTPTEITQELDFKEKSTALRKRPQKLSLLAKQTKTKPLPPPLRNRSKRRMQTWMWVLATVLVIAIFLVGNIGFSFKFGISSFGF